MNPPQQVYHSQKIGLFCNAALTNMKSGTIYTDLPGRFPVRSIRNMQYIFVCYAYQPNTILVQLIKSRNTECMLKAFKNIYDYLGNKDFKPQ